MIIRPETPADIETIEAITIAAFADCPHGDHTEQFIVRALRAAYALTLSLVAESEGRVVAHLAFSPVTIAGRYCDWFGLGPISVRPDLQKQGIGSALLREGLQRLQNNGAKGCLLVGDPNFYQRFGFQHDPNLTLEGVPPEVLLALPFNSTVPHGPVQFHPAFTATA